MKRPNLYGLAASWYNAPVSYTHLSKVREAIYFDPMCSAKLSLQEIKDMVDEMFEAINPYLPPFN